MTRSLKTIIAKLERLSPSEQSEIAKLLYEELKWNKSFCNSQEKLSLLLEEAIFEYRKGRTKRLFENNKMS